MLPSSSIVLTTSKKEANFTTALCSSQGLLPVLAPESGRGMLSRTARCRATGSNRAKESKTWRLRIFKKCGVLSPIKSVKQREGRREKKGNEGKKEFLRSGLCSQRDVCLDGHGRCFARPWHFAQSRSLFGLAHEWAFATHKILPVANHRLSQERFSKPYRETVRKWLESMAKKARCRTEKEKWNSNQAEVYCSLLTYKTIQKEQFTIT